MKYFEIESPYYALIRVENEEEAAITYKEVVSDAIEEMKEVSRDYALVKFSQAKDEQGNLLHPKEAVTEFNDKDLVVLLIDGSLI